MRNITHYLAHQSVDVKCGIITDVYVTSARRGFIWHYGFSVRKYLHEFKN